MLIICTFIICIAICIGTTSFIKLAKFDKLNIAKKSSVLGVLFVTYVCSFIALFILFKQYTDFNILKYLGLCFYWLFAGVMLFSILKFIFFSKKSNINTNHESTVEFVKKITYVTILATLWIVSNTLLDKSLYIIFSFPVLMFLLVFIILVKFVLVRRQQLNGRS